MGSHEQTRPSPSLDSASDASDEEIQQIVVAYRSGVTVLELARRHGCHRTTVTQVLERRGATRRPLSTDPALLEQAMGLYQSGLSLARVGAAVGVSANTVLTHLRKAGIEIRGRHDWERS